MKNTLKVLAIAAGMQSLFSAASADGIDPGEVKIYDNDFPVIVNGVSTERQILGKYDISGASMSANFNFMTILCATPSNGLVDNAIIRSHFYQGEMEWVVGESANPANWYDVETYLEKPHDYAITPDGKTEFLDTPEKFQSFLKQLKAGQWDIKGYPREKVQDFVAMASLQCGGGY